MENRITELEKRVKRISRINLALTIITAGVLFSFAYQPAKTADVIRARGLVIVDSLGRERILIGAPTPFARNRVRTDLKRVEKIWGKMFPKEYMNWYKEYNHQANGIIILDEKGFDKIAIGDPTPDPNIGKRIAPATGIDINDQLGFERTGYGLMRVDSTYRIVMGFDSKQGTEGMYFMLSDDGVNGIGIRDKKKEIFIGKSPGEYMHKDLKGMFYGLLVKDSSGVRLNSNYR
ncbi:MAG TPA: hypothetical protein VK177_10410 [Flavobacteriales bacterium]|nr:hypothetical protein [Flavobacteriales bacterium]